MVMIDTDVLIWYLRGNVKAFDVIEKLDGFFVSVVTYMELVQGMRDKKELMMLRRSMRNWNAKIIYINEDISTKAMFYIEEHYLSNSLQLADALIAASAISNGLKLMTGNSKHYKVLNELIIDTFKP